MKFKRIRQLVVPRKLTEGQIQRALDAARKNGLIAEARMERGKTIARDIVNDFWDAACELVENGDSELYSDVFFIEMMYQYRKWWKSLSWRVRLGRTLEWWWWKRPRRGKGT